MNILKDPPKSIHTRKIDKVGDIQEIMNQQEDAGDRICEMIKVYPRGQNHLLMFNIVIMEHLEGKIDKLVQVVQFLLGVLDLLVILDRCRIKWNWRC